MNSSFVVTKATNIDNLSVSGTYRRGKITIWESILKWWLALALCGLIKSAFIIL